jgi:hypothetical protein
MAAYKNEKLPRNLIAVPKSTSNWQNPEGWGRYVEQDPGECTTDMTS